MTIQPSVTIWTVICFCLLMLILQNLLFKPVLEVMDRRRKRIASAAAKKAGFEQAEQEHALALREKEAAFLSARQKEVKEEIERIRSDSKKAVEAARVERLRTVDEYRVKSAQEHEEILTTLSAHAAELAAAFAGSVTREKP